MATHADLVALTQTSSEVRGGRLARALLPDKAVDLVRCSLYLRFDERRPRQRAIWLLRFNILTFAWVGAFCDRSGIGETTTAPGRSVPGTSRLKGNRPLLRPGPISLTDKVRRTYMLSLSMREPRCTSHPICPATAHAVRGVSCPFIFVQTMFETSECIYEPLAVAAISGSRA